MSVLAFSCTDAWARAAQALVFGQSASLTIQSWWPLSAQLAYWLPGSPPAAWIRSLHKASSSHGSWQLGPKVCNLGLAQPTTRLSALCGMVAAQGRLCSPRPRLQVRPGA